MPIPYITALPDAPLRSGAPATFTSKAEAWVAALDGFTGEANTLADYLGAISASSGPITATDLTMATARLLGRTTALTGAIEEISIGAGLSLSGGTLATSIDYQFGLFFTTAPTASEVLCLHIAAEAFTFPANFSTSKGAAGTAPAASFDIDVQRQVNATGAFSSIGTITISTGGAFTFATAGGTAKAIAVNDVLRFVAPVTPDASIANVAITNRGAR